MPAKQRRHHAARLLLALVVGLAAALPVPSLAAAPAAHIGDGGAASAHLDRGYLDQRAGERPREHGASLGWFVPIGRPEDEIGEIDVLRAARAAVERAAAEAAARAAAEAAAKAAAEKAKAAATYSGRNHVWIPSLGVSRSVESFACTRSTPPANRIYRWGCAGRNNVYLFGHAWGVMKPLHDAYVTGTLKLGMKVIYADGQGRVRTYRVTAIRVVTPDNVDWAIAAQSKPSMTLQTCVGANSDRRLLVRLVAD